MQTENQNVQSHIQMPKLLLKQFHNQSSHFYYYDITKKYIGTRGSANSLNTEYGYYSIQTEHYLRDRVETSFGKVLATIRTIDFKQDTISIDSSFKPIVMDFIFSLIARDPILQRELQKNSIYAQFLPIRVQHDFAATHGVDIGRKNNMFADYILTFIVNQTNIPFVLPIGGLYNYSLNGHSCVNLPISPQLALCLVHKDYAERLIHKETISMFSTDISDTIMCMNNVAFKAQVERDWGYVVCPEREELDRLKASL